MMTRKHFKSIADALSKEICYNHTNDMQTVENIVDVLCSEFKQINSNFNKDRFIDAVFAEFDKKYPEGR